jgi:hypothetical protein
VIREVRENAHTPADLIGCLLVAVPVGAAPEDHYAAGTGSVWRLTALSGHGSEQIPGRGQPQSASPDGLPGAGKTARARELAALGPGGLRLSSSHGPRTWSAAVNGKRPSGAEVVAVLAHGPDVGG